MNGIVIAGVPKISFVNAKDNTTIESCLDILKYEKKNDIIEFFCSCPYEIDNSFLVNNKVKIKIIFWKYNIGDSKKIGDYIEEYYVSSIEKYVRKATYDTTAIMKFIVATE